MPFRKLWNQLKNSPPGRRFITFYEARQKQRGSESPWQRPVYVAAGVVLTLGGIVLLGMPGPGLLVVALGLALIAGEFAFMARILDKAELLLRSWAEAGAALWKRMRPLQRALAVLAVTALAVSAAFGVYVVVM